MWNVFILPSHWSDSLVGCGIQGWELFSGRNVKALFLCLPVLPLRSLSSFRSLLCLRPDYYYFFPLLEAFLISLSLVFLISRWRALARTYFFIHCVGHLEPPCVPLLMSSPLLNVFPFDKSRDVGRWTTGTDLLVLSFVSYFIFSFVLFYFLWDCLNLIIQFSYCIGNFCCLLNSQEVFLTVFLKASCSCFRCSIFSYFP